MIREKRRKTRKHELEIDVENGKLDVDLEKGIVTVHIMEGLLD